MTRLRKLTQHRRSATKQILRRITVPVLAAMYVFIILVGVMLNTLSSERRLEKIYSQVAVELGYTKAAADVYFEGLVRTAQSLRIDGNVTSFFNYPDIEIQQLGATLETVSNTLGAMTSLHSIYLLTSESDSLFYFTRYSYYKQNKSSFPDSDIFDFIKSSEMTPGGIIFREITEPSGIQRDVFTTIGYDGFVGDNGPIVAVVINMKAALINSLISISSGEQTTMALTDASGNVIVSSGTLEDAQQARIEKNGSSVAGFDVCESGGMTYYTVSEELERSGMTLVRLVSENEIEESLRTYILMAVLLTLLALMVVTLGWYVLRHWIGKPITELAQRAASMEKRLYASEQTVHMQALRSLMQHGPIYSEERRIMLLKETKLPFEPNELIFFMEILLCEHLAQLSRNGERAYEALIYGIGNIVQETVSADVKCTVINRVANGSFCIIGAPNRDAWDRLPDIVANAVDAINAALVHSLGVQVVTLYSLRSIEANRIGELSKRVTHVTESRTFFAPGAAIDVDEFLAADNMEVIKNVLKRTGEYMTAMLAESFERAEDLLDSVLSVSNMQEMRFTWFVMTMTVMPQLCNTYPPDVCVKSKEFLAGSEYVLMARREEITSWICEWHSIITSEIDSYHAGRRGGLSQRADELIQENFSSPGLNVAGLAEQLGVTPNYLSAVYRRETSIKLTDTIQNTRISSAQSMLETTDMLVSEIAVACGFAYNIGYFQQLFKKKTGITPSQYRDSHQRGEDKEQ